MSSRLMVISGPDRGRVLTIPPEGGMVGRGDSCSMRLGDAAVSREHFRIGVRDGKPLVIDMGSTNRTVVNGEPVTMRTLSPGDRIEIGHSVIEVIGEGEVACTGTGTTLHAEHDADAVAAAIGSGSDPAFLAEALRALATLSVGLPRATTSAQVCELAVAALGRALGAIRFQILRDSDGDKGNAFAVVTGKTDDEEAPVGAVPIDRAVLVKVAEQRKAILATDGDRGALAVPLLIESTPSLLVADRPGTTWDVGALAVAMVAARAMEAAIEGLSRGGRDASERENLVEIDGDSSVAARMREWITWLAQRPEAALLIGPPGSGKERLAEAVHRRSARAPGPFVVAHCAGMTESLVESELFGHESASGGERKPGKLEAARGGTLFLDELAALPARSQKRLSRALDLGYLERSSGGKTPLDVRIIAGSCTDLMAMVQTGALREDLYRKLAGQVMMVPSLVERQTDIIGLAEKLLYELSAQAGQRRSGFAADAATRLVHHDWLGNVRELRNTVERLVLQGSADPVTLFDVERALIRRQ
jgi:transcriptional regulator of acetoin/glycerol metabolism